MEINVGRINLDQAKIRAAIHTPDADRALFQKMVEAKELATLIFLAQVKHSNGVTPPPYITRFHIDKVQNRWRLRNDDPAAFWVEFGAYIPPQPTAHPQILKYMPLRRAMDALDTME